jgi:hypothetical protein
MCLLLGPNPCSKGKHTWVESFDAVHCLGCGQEIEARESISPLELARNARLTLQLTVEQTQTLHHIEGAEGWLSGQART